MKKAEKKWWLEAGFRKVSRTLIRREFLNVYVDLPAAPVPSYGLFLLNHSSWWDGLVLHLLNDKVLKTDGHIMIEEKGLQQFPIFRYVGGFSIDRSSFRHVRQSLLYATELLDSRKGVFLFPQGEEVHQEQRPFRFLKGAAHLINKVPDIPVTPILIYYSFGHHKKPEVYLSVGAPIWDGSSLSAFERKMETQLDELKQKVIKEETTHFQPLM